MSIQTSKLLLLLVPVLVLTLSCGQSQPSNQQQSQATSVTTEQTPSGNTATIQPLQAGPAPSIPDFTFYILKSGIRFEKSNLTAGHKHVFVLFDPSCSFCQHEARDLGKNIAKFQNTSFYFISMNDPALMSTFFDRFAKELNDRPNVHMLYDRNADFINKFHMPSQFPANYIYDSNGLLKTYWNGVKTEEELIQTLLK